MIRDKSELQVGKTIVNEKKHFKQESLITKIDNEYVYCILHKQNTVMPINFYLNKHQFSLKK